MSGLQITVTTAGRAAIVNAENTGTAPVRIAQIGITAQAFTPNAGMTALPGEIKRLTTFAGAAVADDTVHVTVRDDSADVYTMRGFALYLENGTLFALYGQAGAILEKSAQAMMLLAADIRFVQVQATSLTFGDTDWMNPPATTEVPGVVELATDAEAVAGADATRALTPSGAKAMLDDRFGMGAPSSFVRGLLNLATAALFRTAIGLGSAALRNEGSGNGLDSDLLDGQHGAYYRDWNNLLNRPATYPPNGHRHAWADLDGVPSTATRWPSFAEVTDKPASYPPSAHTHAAADVTSGVFHPDRIPDLGISKITGLQTALNAKAPSHAPTFTGVVSAGDGVFTAKAPVGQGAHYWLVDENGAQQGLLYWDRGGDAIRLRRYGADGQTVDGEIILGGDGIIYTQGDFRPGGSLQVESGARSQIVAGGWASLSGNGNGNAMLSNNVAYWNDGSYRIERTHPNLGGSGIVLQAFGDAGPYFFDLGDVSVTAGQQVNPTFHRMWHAGNFDPNAKANANSNTAGYIRLTGSTNAYYIVDRTSGRDWAWWAQGDSMLLWNGSGSVVSFSPTGAVVASGGFQHGSSLALKTDLEPLPYGLAAVERIEVARGRYKRELDDARRLRLFVIAEQLAEVVPEAVFADAIEHEGERVPSVDYMQLVPVLIRAVQELATEFRSLKERVDGVPEVR